MASLADAIERYIKRLFAESGSGDFIVLRRVELADRFACVPSQINYVLETRFTPERGYAVESRRGGGGYIRILRLMPPPPTRIDSIRWYLERVGTAISLRRSELLLQEMEEAGLLSAREAVLWRATLRRQTDWVPYALRDQVRATLLHGLLMVRFFSEWTGAGPSPSERAELDGDDPDRHPHGAG